MKFEYEYRTKENEIKRGTTSAANRDGVYSALKEKGIRPSRVEEAPGILNKLFGKGKRWIAILVLLVIAVGATMALTTTKKELKEVKEEVAIVTLPFEDMTRRQLIGDTMVIEKGIRDGWSDVFEGEGERFLAGFAVPGVQVSVRNTSEEEITAALSRKIAVEPTDGLEARQIKALVEGMKEELREFIKDGGTIKEYGAALVSRQEQEIAYYTRAKNEIDQLKANGVSEDELYQVWEDRNNKLRSMGIKIVAFPE